MIVKRGALFCLRLAVKGSRNVWQLLCAVPKLLIPCVFFKKNILFICRRSGIGDIVCTLPSVAALKQNHPQSIIVYRTRFDFITLVRRSRYVDLVVEEGSSLDELLQKLFKPKIAFDPRLPDEQTPPKPRKRIHLIEEFRILFGLASLNERAPQLDISARALRQVKQRLQNENILGKPFVVIHSGPTWKVKEWPDYKWHELVAELKARNQIEVIQIGEDRTSYGEKRASPRITGVIRWVGTLTLDQTLALLSLTDLFLGVDSGLLHMAGAVDAPCVGIFGPTDPACFLPRTGRTAAVTANVSCLGCHHNSQGSGHWQSGCPNGIRCMSELSVNEVLVACEKFLKEDHESY